MMLSMVTESYSDEREIELVKASINGDKNAFGEIVRIHRKMVASYCKGNAR